MILSFHPRIKGDLNFRLPNKKPLSPEVADIAAAARAIIATQHIKPGQYVQLASLGPRLFPDYSRRFGFEGKCGNIALFRKYDAPHPVTWLYDSIEAFEKRHFEDGAPVPDFPFVLKGDRGGGGWAVFLAKDIAALKKYLHVLRNPAIHPTKRFLAQAYVNHQGSDLRVVVLGEKTIAYWRCQNKPGEFRNNVGRGATVHHTLDPHLRDHGIACVKSFCKKTGINLAAFDVLFDRSLSAPEPLLSEINFLFGRKGLGGSPNFYVLLNDAVKQWLEKDE